LGVSDSPRKLDRDPLHKRADHGPENHAHLRKIGLKYAAFARNGTREKIASLLLPVIASADAVGVGGETSSPTNLVGSWKAI